MSDVIIYILVLAVFVGLYFITKNRSDRGEDERTAAKEAVEITEKFHEYNYVQLYRFEDPADRNRGKFVFIGLKPASDNSIYLPDNGNYYVVAEYLDDKSYHKATQKIDALRPLLPHGKYDCSHGDPYMSWETYLERVAKEIARKQRKNTESNEQA